MTRTETETKAKRLELELREDGTWSKINTFMRVAGEFVIVKEGDSLVVHDGKNWLARR